WARAFLYKLNDTRETRWVALADDAANRAEKLAPELPEVHTTRGELLLRTGHPQEAVDSFERALSLQPNSFSAKLGLAQAYEEAHQGTQAETTYRSAISLQPGYWMGYSQLAGFLSRRGQFGQAAG